MQGLGLGGASRWHHDANAKPQPSRHGMSHLLFHDSTAGFNKALAIGGLKMETESDKAMFNEFGKVSNPETAVALSMDQMAALMEVFDQIHVRRIDRGLATRKHPFRFPLLGFVVE